MSDDECGANENDVDESVGGDWSERFCRGVRYNRSCYGYKTLCQPLR